jgi:hypothetical protein
MPRACRRRLVPEYPHAYPAAKACRTSRRKRGAAEESAVAPDRAPSRRPVLCKGNKLYGYRLLLSGILIPQSVLLALGIENIEEVGHTSVIALLREFDSATTFL